MRHMLSPPHSARNLDLAFLYFSLISAVGTCRSISFRFLNSCGCSVSERGLFVAAARNQFVTTNLSIFLEMCAFQSRHLGEVTASRVHALCICLQMWLYVCK
jgi:hypothetical protein